MNLLLDLLAVHRLTRLITRDEITNPLRETTEKEIGTAVTAKIISQSTADKLIYLMGCDWCASIWAASFALAMRRYMPDFWNNLKYVLAASTVTGFIASYE